jgi:hypothetical protein
MNPSDLFVVRGCVRVGFRVIGTMADAKGSKVLVLNKLKTIEENRARYNGWPSNPGDSQWRYPKAIAVVWEAFHNNPPPT